jgi:hypothetical protein
MSRSSPGLQLSILISKHFKFPNVTHNIRQITLEAASMEHEARVSHDFKCKEFNRTALLCHTRRAVYDV